jgi:hypothetical protein
MKQVSSLLSSDRVGTIAKARNEEKRQTSEWGIMSRICNNDKTTFATCRFKACAMPSTLTFVSAFTFTARISMSRSRSLRHKIICHMVFST